ncbi:hypothetical protein VTN77DRAFT_8252 [Rasamsonia byssochlamydoides]|uniref:uncharacterized protein n=1 Tax=Rasamsonia byssochlamydoides TaxID=89139 RepID=UPI003743CC4B
MPHKHKRRKKDESVYDLPPNVVAKPLPVREDKTRKDSKNGAKKKKQKQFVAARKATPEDDTPREFKRLMQYQKMGKLPSGLDDGQPTSQNSKKRKREETEGAKEGASIPKIMPGEKLSDFAARVDQALPLSGIKKSHRPPSSLDLPKLREERVTKHEKRLRRLQQQWREEEARIREREEEEREEKEAELEEQLELWKEWEREAGKGKAKKKKSGKSKKKRRKGNNDPDAADPDDDDDDDPWAVLNARAKPANPFEVVQAPPQSLPKPKEVFKVRRGAGVDVANVPAAAGSLRRREELAAERKSIVEQYRQLMAEKRQK